MTATTIQILGTTTFALAVLHTFFTSVFQKLAQKYSEGSIGENIYHTLGEVEVVFGLWAAIFLIGFALISGTSEAIQYAESLNYTEALFVFAIMAVAGTKPIIMLARLIITSFSRIIPLRTKHAKYLSCLVIGPILGSFITEPAAMTVTAIILLDSYFSKKVSTRFRYITIATLFVNISIGGVLTPFAAPPVLMVASTWNWDLAFMLSHFGWRAVLITIVNAAIALFVLRKEIGSLNLEASAPQNESKSPVWLTAVHLAFLAFIVATAHHPVIFIGGFLIFLGIASISKEYQDELMLKQSLLVAFFLAGLVVLGGQQRWWLEPLLMNLSETAVFFGAAALTAITDNAAITYLASQIESLSDGFKYAIVSGAIAGGGLTVIANAPNPAGFAILQRSFGEDGISPVQLFVAALIPTFVALIILFI